MPKLGQQLETVLLKALSKTPADRYQTAGELAAAFHESLLESPTNIAPAGAAVLPDYTPLGVTQVKEVKPSFHHLWPICRMRQPAN